MCQETNQTNTSPQEYTQQMNQQTDDEVCDYDCQVHTPDGVLIAARVFASI